MKSCKIRTNETGCLHPADDAVDFCASLKDIPHFELAKMMKPLQVFFVRLKLGRQSLDEVNFNMCSI